MEEIKSASSIFAAILSEFCCIYVKISTSYRSLFFWERNHLNWDAEMKRKIIIFIIFKLFAQFDKLIDLKKLKVTLLLLIFFIFRCLIYYQRVFSTYVCFIAPWFKLKNHINLIFEKQMLDFFPMARDFFNQQKFRKNKQKKKESKQTSISHEMARISQPN